MSHESALKFIQNWIAHERILRLSQKWVKAGVGTTEPRYCTALAGETACPTDATQGQNVETPERRYCPAGAEDEAGDHRNTARKPAGGFRACCR